MYAAIITTGAHVSVEPPALTSRETYFEQQRRLILVMYAAIITMGAHVSVDPPSLISTKQTQLGKHEGM